MKLKTSALAMTATLAAGLISSAFADATVTPYEKLGFKTNLTYKVEVNDSTKTDTNGTWNVSAAPFTVAGGAIEFDSDASTPSTFTPATDNSNSTCDATELKFNVSAAIVPKNVTLATDADAADAQCGFAIKATDNATNYMVYVGSDSDPAWVPAGACGLTADEYFDLTVKIDYRNSVAQYVVTKDGQSSTLGNQWYPLAAKKTSVGAIDFIGNGKLTSLRGDKLQIISEVIVVNPGSGDVNIVVPEATMNAIRDDGKDPATFLSDTTKGTNDRLTNLDRLAITGALTDPKEVANLPKTVAKPFDAGENKLAIKLDNLAKSLPKIEGATPTFTLQGSNDKNDELAWADIKSNNDGKAFEFNAATYNYKYYRVKATVEYGSAK